MFGISTHLYVGDRLDRDHLVEIAAHGFEASKCSRCAITSTTAIAAPPSRWPNGSTTRACACTRCTRRSPVAMPAASWKDGLSLAVGRRSAAARRRSTKRWRRSTSPPRCRTRCWSCTAACRSRTPAPGDNHRGSLVRSLEELSPVAQRYGVRLAIEVIPNELSTPSALVDLIESDIDARARHLHGRRSRADDGRCRRCDRNLLGPRDHDAPARQSRPQRRSPGARQGRDRLGRGHAGVSEGRLRRRLDVRARRRRRTPADPRAGREGARTVRVAAAHRRRDARVGREHLAPAPST